LHINVPAQTQVEKCESDFRHALLRSELIHVASSRTNVGSQLRRSVINAADAGDDDGAGDAAATDA